MKKFYLDELIIKGIIMYILHTFVDIKVELFIDPLRGLFELVVKPHNNHGVERIHDCQSQTKPILKEMNCLHVLITD